MADRTERIETGINKEKTPRLVHLLRLWQFVFSSAKSVSLIFLGLMIFLALLRPVGAFVWGRYLDRTAAFGPGDSLLPLVLSVSLFYLINLLTGLLQRYTEGFEDIERLDLVQANRFEEMVNSRVLDKLAAIDPEYWEAPKINALADRTFKFISDRQEGMNRGVMVQGYLVLAKSISVLSIAASLYVFHPSLSLIVLIAAIPSLYTLLFSHKLLFKFVKGNSEVLRRAKYFQDVLLRTGAKEVKTMGLFDFFFGKWKVLMDEYTLKEKKLYRNWTLINMAGDLLMVGANVSANILVIYFMAKGKISLGALGACMVLISTLLADTTALLSALAKFLTRKNEAAQFYDLLELAERRGEINIAGLASLVAKDLHYRYPLTEHYALRGVDFAIRKGEKVAFVGENGAGKTTFVKILTGLLLPGKGELLINDFAGEKVALEDRFAALSCVSQEPIKYLTFTLAENVYLGDTLKAPAADRIVEALAFSGLDEIAPATLLGKEIGGTDLSGGEWQKLAIARAVYRNRDFIILDEPTGNHDPLAETEIFKKYLQLAADKTVIFVTHRISVAALAERIVVFDKGKIIEEGRHEELLALQGKYASLYKEQAKWYNRAPAQ